MQKYKLLAATSKKTGRPAVGASGRLVGQIVETSYPTSIFLQRGIVIWATDGSGDGIHTSKVTDVEWDGSKRQLILHTLNTVYKLEQL